MKIRWWELSQKGVIERRTDGQTENTICSAAWSQLKNMKQEKSWLYISNNSLNAKQIFINSDKNIYGKEHYRDMDQLEMKGKGGYLDNLFSDIAELFLNNMHISTD